MSFVRQIENKPLEICAVQLDGFVEAELPEDTTHRSAWRLVGGVVVIDKPAKAVIDKDIGKQDLNSELHDMTYTYADGRVIQTRPADLTNIEIAIAQGADRKWIMNDDTVELLTVAELTEARNASIGTGTDHWNTYVDLVEAL